MIRRRSTPQHTIVRSNVLDGATGRAANDVEVSGHAVSCCVQETVVSLRQLHSETW